MNRKEAIQLATNWFEKRNWKVFPFQKKSWKAYLSNKSGLLNSPTGSGKTLALAVPIILENIKQNPKYLTKRTAGLKALWITPLRSLSTDIKLSIEQFSQEVSPKFRIEIRNGDTTPSAKAKQKRSMPDMLITTPETLHLLLASKGYDELFKSLETVVIDEWHELLGSKRGVQIELGLSRLKALRKNLKIWGISATIGNLNEAQKVLLGQQSEQGELIQANIKKKIKVKSIIPPKMEKFPWRGHLGLHLLEQVFPIVDASKSTLIFTNTRAQCELWFQALLDQHPDLAGLIAMHHSSIEKKNRLWVENALKEGLLKVVVCTSSLDLGVDFTPVETIIQIGSPKGVARFLQRAGRSGHRPDVQSVIHFLPTHAIELVEASALQTAVKKQIIEERIPYLLSFDVLIQYLITLAISNGFKPNEIFNEVKATYCFQTITEKQWAWILNFIVNGSQSLSVYDEYQKVKSENGIFKVENKRIAMRHRMQIGTIVSDQNLPVKFLTGGRIGMIEELFVSKLIRGDIFTFAGRRLEFRKIKDMTVLVKKAKTSNTKAKVVTWMGGRMSLSSQMSSILREELYQHESRKNPEFKALKHIIERQKRESIIPKKGQFLIETFKTREGYHNIFYPFEGRAVHEALSSLLAYRISLLHSISFSLAFNDYGFELLSDQPVDIEEVLDNNLFSPDYLKEDLQKSLNSTEIAGRAFREIAVISGLVFTGYPGKFVKSKHLQASSRLIFDVFREYEADNLLLQQAYWETFEHKLEESRLREALQLIAQQEVIWKQCKKPTPFSFPIITDRLREKLTSENLADRIKKMQLSFD